MRKGIDSLRLAVLKDTKEGENCFNENGCDHEYSRMVKQDNPSLIELGITKACKRVSKCSHKYCDKYKWVMDRAKYYAERTGKDYEEIIEIWESNRDYWYMNYYQENNQPLKGMQKDASRITETSKRIKHLKGEIETYEFLASTLDAEHQESVKNELLSKVENMKRDLNDCESRMRLYEIMCFN